MDNQPIETKNYRKPKKNKNPMTMLVIGFIVGAALSTGSFWAGALYASGRDDQNTPAMVQTTATTATTATTTTTIYTTTTHSYDTPDTLKESVGLMYEVTSDTTCEITGLGTCADTKIVIPKYIDGYEVTSLGGYVFYHHDRLTNVMIPDSVTSIGDYAFSFCKSLTSVTIPDSVMIIGDRAFYACESLTNVTIGNGVTSIGEGAFSYCDNLASITVFDGNKAYKSINGVLFAYDEKTLICYPNGKQEISYIIPNSVTGIEASAFYACDSLTNVTIPDSVTSIGSKAFYDCNGLKNVTIGNSVTSIGAYAFDSCDSLTSITIPDSVTSIGRSAFSSCSRLTSITYNGKISEWNAISKVFSWNSNTPDYTVYCTDATITKSGEITYN